MVATTFAALALGATLSPGAAVTPDWRTDYRQAIVVAQTEAKPVAVFIGRGAPAVPAEAAALLANKFVCLTVDTATTEGKELAGKFGMTDGLVISNAGGKVQALRHAGAVPAGELAGYLAKYGDPNRAVVTTEQVGAEAPATVVPASYSAPVYRGPVIRTLGGGCPNGRCPNAR